MVASVSDRDPTGSLRIRRIQDRIIVADDPGLDQTDPFPGRGPLLRGPRGRVPHQQLVLSLDDER